MKNMQKKSFIVLGIGFMLLSIVAIPSYSFAEDNVGSTTPPVKQIKPVRTANVTKMTERANKEIARRVEALNKLGSRVQGMKKVPDTAKASIATNIQTQITSLTDLKDKISTEPDATVLQADLKSITSSYRIFALVIPQGHITAASDKIVAIAGNLKVIVQKLQTRITEAETAGKDVTSINTTLADMTTKISYAETQAKNAVNLIYPLIPDGGDTAKASANKTALESAKASIKTANKDLNDAKKDATSIIKMLQAFKLKKATATPTPAVSPVVTQ
jgi:hypothetical protein